MEPTIFSALANFAFLVAPAVIYAIVVRFKSHLSWSEIAERLGLRKPQSPYLVVGAVLAIFGSGVTVAMTFMGFGFSDKGSPIHFLVGQSPTSALVWAAFLYAFVSTGPGEEILFRGLIGGVLLRRVQRRWLSNSLQALVFTAPHALILLVRPDLWFAIPVVFALGLVCGWLRIRSMSVVPSALVHAFGNFGAALSVLSW